MKYLRYLAILGVMVMLPLTYSQAQVRVGVGVGVGPGYVAGPPACAYGYYSYYPYACAPYGYYGPSWFSGGVFIGAGPWFHGPSDFRGHVDTTYHPEHGYKGEYPKAGEKPREGWHGTPENFHGNEVRDGRGHVEK